MSATSDTVGMRFALALLVAGIVAAAPVAAGTQPPRIAFDYGLTTGNPDVITTNPDGSAPLDLTPGTPSVFTADLHPSWSPDGTRIVFDSHRDSNVSTEIYVMNADGSGQERLTHDSGQGAIFNTNPLWSPRGDLIAYEKSLNGQNDDLWVMRPDGSGQRQLTSDGGSKARVSWSPDGNRLLYTRNEQAHDRIYVVGLDGRPPVSLSPPDASDSSPVWSPDGTRIAFTSPGLTVMDADGSNRRILSLIGSSAPAWSPDGTRIAFSGLRSFPQYGSRFGTPFREDVFVVDADGSDLHRLTGPFSDDLYGAAGGTQPTWWPDSSRLFFVSQREAGPSTTFVMNADGTCEQEFRPRQYPADLVDPVWQPGGGPLPPITRCAELRISAEVDKSPVALNEPAVWTLRVDNDGNEPAQSVLVDVTTPDDAKLSTPGACGPNDVNLDCQVGPIPPGGSASLSITGTRRTGGPIQLLARVSANEPDTDPSNNSISVAAQVLACTIVGTSGNDTLVGTDGPDRICGLPGADTIYGGKGDDFIDAGNGDDRIYPGPGRDTVIARGGNDVIYARDGRRDWIDCGAQHDIAIVDRVDVVRHCEIVVRPPR